MTPSHLDVNAADKPRPFMLGVMMTSTGRLMIALPVLAMTALAPAVANAQYYRGGYGGYRGGYGHGYGHRGYGGGAIVGGALLGLGVGALLARPYYAPPPVYYAPPPVVYAPPPVYYAPSYPAPAYAAPAYSAPAYYPPGYYGR